MAKQKEKFVVQQETVVGDQDLFVDTEIGQGVCTTDACIRAIRAGGREGRFRIIAVKRYVTTTIEKITRVAVE